MSEMFSGVWGTLWVRRPRLSVASFVISVLCRASAAEEVLARGGMDTGRGLQCLCQNGAVKDLAVTDNVKGNVRVSYLNQVVSGSQVIKGNTAQLVLMRIWFKKERRS